MVDANVQLTRAVSANLYRRITSDKDLANWFTNVNANTTHEDVQKFAMKLGDYLGIAFAEEIRRDTLPDETLYWNIAKNTIDPMIQNAYDAVNKASVAAQKVIDAKEGLNLAIEEARLSENRMRGALNSIAEEGIDDEQLSYRLHQYTKNIVRSASDDFQKVNFEKRSAVGLDTFVVRKAVGDTCKWCSSMAGTYDYSEVSKTGNDVWRRHKECDCEISFTNRRKKYTEIVKNFNLKNKKEHLQSGSNYMVEYLSTLAID